MLLHLSQAGTWAGYGALTLKYKTCGCKDGTTLYTISLTFITEALGLYLYAGAGVTHFDAGVLLFQLGISQFFLLFLLGCYIYGQK